MFTPGNVVYAFCNNTNPPKNKYMISLYRGLDFDLVFSFTTSQPRAGVPEEQVHHGIIKNDAGDSISYVFEAGHEIGTTPDGKRFSFPKRTVITFDYGLHMTKLDQLLKTIENPVLKCKLDEKEYEDLIYALMRSPRTQEKFKPVFDQILIKLFAAKEQQK